MFQKLSEKQLAALVYLNTQNIKFEDKSIAYPQTLQSLMRNSLANIKHYGPGGYWEITKKGSQVVADYTASQCIKTEDPFILHIQKEMDWNQAKVVEIDRDNKQHMETVHWHSELMPNEWHRAFMYSCLAGSSVKKEISSCIDEFFDRINFPQKYKVIADSSNRRGDSNHLYLIILLNKNHENYKQHK